MHRNICSSAGVSSLRVPLATTMAIVMHPERAAWQSMCATDEGMLKGEQWCRKCIWGNLLPEWKHAFGSVEKIQSGDFDSLWTARIDHLPTGSACRRTPRRRTARLLRHPLKAKLVVPRPSPAVIFERLSLMRDIVWLPQMVRLPSLPLLSSLKAVE
jgi:hypothetical protein